MKKPIIVIKLTPLQFSAIKDLAQRVHQSMQFNANFVNPQPTLVALQAATTELSTAIEKWGPQGNRGSHMDYAKLKQSAMVLHKMLTQIAAWCMSTLAADLDYADQTTILTSSGFELKRAGSPQGVLETVQNLHRFISRNVRQEQVKLSWKKPLNVTTITNVKNYLIYRGLSSSFSDASIVASVSKTTFTEAPGIGAWHYWVVACNNKGHGVADTPLQVEVFKEA